MKKIINTTIKKMKGILDLSESVTFENVLLAIRRIKDIEDLEGRSYRDEVVKKISYKGYEKFLTIELTEKNILISCGRNEVSKEILIKILEYFGGKISIIDYNGIEDITLVDKKYTAELTEEEKQNKRIHKMVKTYFSDKTQEERKIIYRFIRDNKRFINILKEEGVV